MRPKWFKIKYCRECGEKWILRYDDKARAFYGNDFSWFDSNYEFHKVFHAPLKLLSEIREFINWQKEMDNETKT